MNARGFTLIELLVVIAVLALVLVSVPPFFATGVPSATLKAAAREVAAGLRYARSEAVTRNREVVFTIDLDEASYTVGANSRTMSWPDEIDVTLLTARSERIDETSGAIRFFPDGSSTGGGITLALGARKYRVLVDWLNGQVSIVD